MKNVINIFREAPACSAVKVLVGKNYRANRENTKDAEFF